MSLKDMLADFKKLGMEKTANEETGLKKKRKKRGRWKPPPDMARWTDLYSTCSGSIADSLKICQDVIGLIERGERLHIVTNGNWSMEQPICHIGEQLGPCDFWMATWVVNDDAVLRLAETMRQGYIRNCRIVTDERMKVLRPAALDILQVAVGAGNLGIMACHAKFYALRQVDGDFSVAMVGSANWNQNPRPEALVIDTDPRAAELYATWVDNQLDSGRAKPYQHTGKLAEDLLQEHVKWDKTRLTGPDANHDTD